MASVQVGSLRRPAGFSRIVVIKRSQSDFATNERHARVSC
jgi:hypothetical protein